MEFASNCPISRPRDTGRKASWDLNGMSWSWEHGMFYEPGEEIVPIRVPSHRVGRS